MGFWFGRKSAPETRPFVPVWLQGEGEAGGFARGYEAQLDEVYRRNPVGLRAVRLVAGMVGGLPLFGDEPALKLVSTDGLLERVAAALLLHGNSYVQLIADGHDRPAELLPLRPERVSVATDAAGWPSAYVYRVGGKAVRIAKSDALGRGQVAHLKALNPNDDHYGLGCLEAAIGAASVHNRASRWNKALLDNWAAATHSVGEAFCLIDPAAIRRVELPASMAGALLTATAHGLGDIAPLPTGQRLISGESLRPPSPCHLKVLREGIAVQIQWTRRSHRGWIWTDGIGDAENPSVERYRMSITGSAGQILIEGAGTTVSIPISDLPAAPGQSVALSVVTIGPMALSHAATTTFIV